MPAVVAALALGLLSGGQPAFASPTSDERGGARESRNGAQAGPEEVAASSERVRPQAPSVSSWQYPESDPDDPNDAWHDGVGKYGDFTFDSPDADVVAYRYGINSDPTSSNSVSTSGGAPRTVQILPQKRGVNFVTVRAIDAAGNASPIRTYNFRVRAGEPEHLAFDLDEEAGAAEVTGKGALWQARLTGDAAPGGEGYRGGGLHLAGENGYAATEIPVLDTSKSFTVSLWARLPDEGVAASATAVSQNGVDASAYRLYAHPERGWTFAQTPGDTPASEREASQGQPATAGAWTHVAGVFNDADQELVLYVDGERVDDVPWTGAHSRARGATALGAALGGPGGGSDFFSGDLDEVRFHDDWLNDEQVAQLHAGTEPVVGLRPATAVWNFEEAADASSVAGEGQPAEARLHGGAETGTTGVRDGALSFDGETGHALTGRPVVDTSQSYAVSLWAWLPADQENRHMTAVMQGGASGPGFSLHHRPNGGGWSFMGGAAPGSDSADVVVAHSPCEAGAQDCPALGRGTWAHVVGMHDMDAERLELYVNGRFAGSQPYTDRWEATGPVVFGASEHPDGVRDHLDGAIDDVRFYDRVISADEIRGLYERHPVSTGRWQFEQAEGSPPDSTPDSSGAGTPLTLNGGAAIGPGWVDQGALVLDGVDDHAETTTVPVDTSAGFSVAGWAQAATVPEEAVTVFSAAGQHGSAFAVRFVPEPEDPGWGKWQITMADADSASANVVMVTSPMYYDVLEWNHLALVHDGFRRELTLYVNGQRADGSGNVLSFRADHSLQVGRSRSEGQWGEYWPGAIDELRTFHGALSPDHVAELAAQ
ncbi:LamG domain-containing protein [Streptomyces marincola]|uniref:LamG domain-containing protein n=1 Tax=Streptomyces marincola TaxID=2878388 RepID=UPI00131D4645|nr:LamG domain-containing protein [Streptomyces marincola]